MGYSSLHIAADEGDVHRVVEILNGRKAYAMRDVWERSESGWTALFFGTVKRHTNVVVALLKHGADPQDLDHNQRTCLHYAAELGDNNITAHLIANGAKVNQADHLGMTPLHLSLAEGHSEVVQTLTLAGADPNVKNMMGVTCMDMASGPEKRVLMRQSRTDVRQPPPAPSSLRVIGAHPASLIVQWDPPPVPQQLFDFLEYEVSVRTVLTWQKAKDPVELATAHLNIVANEMREFPITNLHTQALRQLPPGALMGITVRARMKPEKETDKPEWGLYLEPMIEFLLAPAPPSQPTKVCVGHRSSNSIEITWEKPMHENGSEIVDYEVCYTIAAMVEGFTDRKIRSVRLGGSASFLNLGGLDPGMSIIRTYVRARNAVGWGWGSQPWIEANAHALLPQPPIHITTEPDVDPNCLHILWDKSDAEGGGTILQTHLVWFEIPVDMSSTHEIDQFWVDSHRDEHHIPVRAVKGEEWSHNTLTRVAGRGTNNGYVYTVDSTYPLRTNASGIRVALRGRFENESGWGEWTENCIVVQSRIAAPDPPRNVRRQLVTPTGVTVVWDPPIRQQYGAPVNDYKVEFRFGSASEAIALMEDQCWFRFQCRYPGKLENFTVRAGNRAGYGEASAPISVQLNGVETSLTGPTRVRGILSVDKSVVVMWERPKGAGDELIGYMLTFTRVTSVVGKGMEYERCKFEVPHDKCYVNVGPVPAGSSLGDVRVACRTSTGFGEHSSPTDVSNSTVESMSALELAKAMENNGLQ